MSGTASSWSVAAGGSPTPLFKPVETLGGTHSSFAFIEQSQTNGVAERFIRTIKEQLIHGRVFQGLQGIQEALRRFLGSCNQKWRVKKQLKKPRQARAQ